MELEVFTCEECGRSMTDLGDALLCELLDRNPGVSVAEARIAERQRRAAK